MAGRPADAETALREILKADPSQPDALNALAALASNGGRLDAAIELQQRAVAARPRAPLYHSNLCEMYRRAGKHAPAIEHGKKAVELRPSFAAAHNNLGVVHADAGDAAAALMCYDAAIAHRPEFAEAHNNRGNALRMLGRLKEAEAVLRHAIVLRPDYADAHNNLGNVLRDMGRAADAEAAHRRALALRPDDLAAQLNLAVVLRDQGKLEMGAALEAAMSAQRVLDSEPENALAANVLGMTSAAAGRSNEAIDAFRRAAAKPGYIDPWLNLGNVLKELGRFEDALAAFDRAREIAPRAGAPLQAIAQVKTFRNDDDPHLAALQALERDLPSLPTLDRLYVHFALGKACQDLGRADAAFAHWQAGAALKRQTAPYDQTRALAQFERTKRTFDAAFMAQARVGFADPAPIFVIGMPRSGTTLVEQIIASHPAVGAAGEITAMNDVVGALGAFPRALRTLDDGAFSRAGEAYARRLRAYAPGAAHVTDKTPSNMYLVGVIHFALPEAKILHVARDPVDTCLSCYSTLFTRGQRHTYDLAELGRHYRAYHDLMLHWADVLPAGRMLRVQYEEVVGDMEGQARRMLAHCGLTWDERVLAFHENGRAVGTASARQVRQPIYSTSVAKWRRYRAHLQPLLAALGDLADCGARP